MTTGQEIKLASDDFRNNLKTIYDGIYDQMNKDFHYQISHIGYSRFFNADDDSTWCNDQTFGKKPWSGLSPPKLTLELRRKLNQLSDDLNGALYANLLGYENDKLNNPGKETARKNGWLVTRTFFANLDAHAPNFEGHRFCEKGVEDPQFGDAKTWILGVWGDQLDVGPDDGNIAGSAATTVGKEYFAQYNAAPCGQDPSYDHDKAFAWDCDMAVYYSDPKNDQSVQTIPGLDFIRSFHPKTRGFTAVKDFIHRAILAMRTAPRVGTCMNAVGPDIASYIDSNGLLAGLDVVNHRVPSGFPASLCATASGLDGFANSMPTSTPTASPPAPAPSCTLTGDPLTGGCKCSDGTTPPRDEDNRCCLYHQPGV